MDERNTVHWRAGWKCIFIRFWFVCGRICIVQRLLLFLSLVMLHLVIHHTLRPTDVCELSVPSHR